MKPPMKASRRVAFAAVALLTAAACFACIHPPIDFQGRVAEGEKEALLFNDGQFAHLVVRTSLTSSETLPGRMAWVIPLPSMPEKIDVVEPALFDELFFLTRPPRDSGGLNRPEMKGESPLPAKAAAPGIRVHAERSVGEYTVQPVEILSESAGGELNAWLSANRFGTVPPENQRFYLKKGAAFLAVKLHGLAGNAAEMKPLHLAYPSPRAVLPLKFSTHSGQFDVTLYTVTAHEPPESMFAPYRLERRRSIALETDELRKSGPTLLKLLGERGGYLTRFHGVNYNRPGNEVAAFAEDPAIAEGPAAAVVPELLKTPPLSRDTLVALLALAGTLVLLALAMRLYSGKTGRPWVRLFIASAAVMSAVFFGARWLADAYENHVARSKAAELILMANRTGVARGKVAEIDMKVVLRSVDLDGRTEVTCEVYPAAARNYAPAGCRR
jgi:uncharacterized protein DUF2330